MGFWAILVILVVPLLIVSIFFGGWVYLILAIPVIVAVVAWIVGGAASPGKSRRAVRQRPELLGPGGPDDPDRR